MNKIPVRIHLTNIAGAGATQLVKSLLPALEAGSSTHVSDMYLPSTGVFKDYCPQQVDTRAETYRRRLPNALSRIWECLNLLRHFKGDTPLLVLGDIPLAHVSKQVVFVQTPNLMETTQVKLSANYARYAISRAIFRLNVKYVDTFIVQTEVMKSRLLASYPIASEKVLVIPQPVPNWLLSTKLKRVGRTNHQADKLSLFYPAASYPHKNHQLLAKIEPSEAQSWAVSQLTLTIGANNSPTPNIAWIHSLDFLSPPAMLKLYSEVDALLFLSLEESFGFPLVEAMYLGLPIICPDLPYARVLCGEQAIYFDPNTIVSLKEAISTLKVKLDQGWWPDWHEQVAVLPANWQVVAEQMLVALVNTTHH